MIEQDLIVPRHYSVDMRQNSAQWFKATLPALPVLVGIGATEEEACKNLRQGLYRELEHRISGFHAIPEPLTQPVGRSLELSLYVAERIQFINRMLSRKIYLQDLCALMRCSEQELRVLLSVINEHEAAHSASAQVQFDLLCVRAAALHREHAG